MADPPGLQAAPRGLVPLLLVNFVGTLGFGIVLPFLVVLVTEFGGNAAVYGVLGATYSGFQLVGAPLLGRWSDTLGRRRVLLLSHAGTFTAWLVFLAALYVPASPWLTVDSPILGSFILTAPLLILFFSRALDGLTGGNVSVANAYLADITAEDQRKQQFGKMAVAANLGLIIGPAVAGLLGDTRWGAAPPVLAALTISAFAMFAITAFLPESSPCTLADDPRKEVTRVFGQEVRDCYQLEGGARSFRDVLHIRNVPLLLALNLLIFVAFSLFYAAFPMHTTRTLDWSVTGLGAFYSFLGLTTALAQGPLLARIGTRVSETPLIIAGAIILAAGFALLASSHRAIIFLGGALFSLGNGLMWPSFLALLSRAGGSSLQGAVQGLSGSAGSLGSIVGLVAGGLLYETIAGFIFPLAGVLILACGAFAARLRPAEDETAAPSHS